MAAYLRPPKASAPVLTALLAVLAALANAISSTLQRKANASEPDGVSFRLALIVDLLRRPVWLGGIAAVTTGFILQAAALTHGELAVVEPILVLELPFTLALASRVFQRPLHRREWLAAIMLCAGLVLLVVGLHPRAGSALHVSPVAWLLTAGATTAVIASLVLQGLRHASQRASLLGIATGAAFGMTAGFMTGVSETFAHNPVSVFSHWQIWAMLCSGLTGMFLLQNALRSGTLVAVQPGLTLTDPLISILWGAVLFNEKVQAGPWLTVEIAGAALIGWGTLRLSRSPLIHDTNPGTDPDDRQGRPAYDVARRPDPTPPLTPPVPP